MRMRPRFIIFLALLAPAMMQTACSGGEAPVEVDQDAPSEISLAEEASGVTPFCMVSAFAGRPVGPPAGTLDDLFARMARDGLAFAPDEMAAALMAETHREAAAAGLAAAPD